MRSTAWDRFVSQFGGSAMAGKREKPDKTVSKHRQGKVLSGQSGPNLRSRQPFLNAIGRSYASLDVASGRQIRISKLGVYSYMNFSRSALVLPAFTMYSAAVFPIALRGVREVETVTGRLSTISRPLNPASATRSGTLIPAAMQ